MHQTRPDPVFLLVDHLVERNRGQNGKKVNYVLCPRNFATGASTAANGGNMENMVTNGLIAMAGMSARHIYNETVGYDVDAGPGGKAQTKLLKTDPIRGADNIGTQGGHEILPDGRIISSVDGHVLSLSERMFVEGGPISKALNMVPGVNAVSGMHDVFQINLDNAWRDVLNVPGMLPAAALSYAAMVDLVPISVVDQVRQ